MQRLELVRSPAPSAWLPRPAAAAPSEAVRRGEPPAQRPRDAFDVFFAGAGGEELRGRDVLLRELAHALLDLAGRRAGKAIVRSYEEAWELCVERFESASTVSVYRGGAEPETALYDWPFPFADVLRDALALVAFAVETADPDAKAPELGPLVRALGEVTPDEGDSIRSEPPPAPVPVSVELERDAPLSFGADFAIRSRSAAHAEPSVERADLHALLFPGRLRAEVRGRSVDLGEGLPFFFAERLLSTARVALDAWERGKPLTLRQTADAVVLGVRLSDQGELALTLGSAHKRGTDRASATFPALRVTDFVEATLAFGRALVRGVLRRDRGQSMNLRLSAFRRELRETESALREVCREDAKVNPTPEPYRAFAALTRVAPTPTDIGPVRLRYGAKWRALVPNIDLRSTFLCGDRLVVGGAQETFCLLRTTGEVLWRTETERATSVVTPGGLARIHADGNVHVHDLGNGDVTLRARIAPRPGGAAPAGAVVNVPGLPRLLIVTEGERHLVALDLTSGEARWRHTWGIGGTVRLKRGGKLLYVVGGDSALTALDVLSGATVWRVRDRLRFRAAPTLDKDLLLAVAGGMSSAAHLRAIDPFSGETRWLARLGEGDGTCTVEGAPLVAESVVAVALRERRGLRLSAYDRETGRALWSTRGPVAPIGTSWLAVDDSFLGNSPMGELLALDARTGTLRYREPLGRALETDVPRRLEPVLRSGALFVPFADVHVFRPRDGVRIGTIAPCDAIPDMLRVDEQCNVYIAEESGHLVAFSAGPRLSLVSPT